MGVHDQLDKLLKESPDIPADLEIFDVFSPGDNNSEYNKTNFWAASLDFTGRSWRSYDADDVEITAPTLSNGTAISPRHVVVAEHSHWDVESFPFPWKLTFIAADGTRHQRTILGWSGQVAGTDIQLLYLDSELPSEIAKYKVLPADYQTYLPTMPTTLAINVPPDYDIVARPPAIATCQHRHAYVHEVFRVEEYAPDKWNITVRSFLGMNSAEEYRLSGDRNAYGAVDDLIPGDSGHPIFMLLGGELVLLACRDKPFITKHLDAVNAAMLALEATYGGSDGYQLQTIALGGALRADRLQVHAAGPLCSEVHVAGSIQDQVHAAGSVRSQIA